MASGVTWWESGGGGGRVCVGAGDGSGEAARGFLESVSPINNIDGSAAPLLVLHGENDPRVPVGEAEQIVEEAREQGVPVRKLIFDDEGHGFAKLDNRIEAYREIVDFLAEHV